MANIDPSHGTLPVLFSNLELLYAEVMLTKLWKETGQKRHQTASEDGSCPEKHPGLDDSGVRDSEHNEKEVGMKHA